MTLKDRKTLDRIIWRDAKFLGHCDKSARTKLNTLHNAKRTKQQDLKNIYNELGSLGFVFTIKKIANKTNIK